MFSALQMIARAVSDGALGARSVEWWGFVTSTRPLRGGP